VIGAACRRLPGDTASDRYREWTAELPAIADDPDIRAAALRAARMLRYAAGAYRSSRQLQRAAGRARPARTAGSAAAGSWASQSRRRPLGRPAIPDGVVLALAAIVLWVTVLMLVRTHSPVGYWNVVGIAGGIGSEALSVVAIIRFIRWARRQSRRPPRP
jgi:hypothetical protein